MLSKITLYHYNADECIFSDNVSLKECAAYENEKHVNWINILGISDPAVLKEAADIFKIHPLVVEDIGNNIQRAKVEEYDDMLYVVLRMFHLKGNTIEDQQVSIVVRNNTIVTFREFDAGIFQKSIGDKLKAGTSSLRKHGEDYLLYSILDAIIDNYYIVLAHISEKIEALERDVMKTMSW